MNEHLTLDEAKQITQQMEMEIANALPAEYVVSVEQRPTGVLLSCATDNGEQWTGSTIITLRGNPDSATLLSSIAEHFTTADGYKTGEREDNGDRLLDVTGRDSSIWIVRHRADEAHAEIDSASPCFRLPEGVDRRGSF